MSEKPEGIDPIQTIRREYDGDVIKKKDLHSDPIKQFSEWFDEALNADIQDANAMILATSGGNGQPSARTVLLKGFDNSGFRFYTNYKSRKAKELEANPKAALCFYWPVLDRQVRIEGEVERVSREESIEYFNIRPRESRLAAWASPQSSSLKSREELVSRFNEVREKFKDKEVPVPDFWGGYLVKPDSVEFWQGRPGRLHDRILYRREGENWIKTRLSP